MPKADEDFTGLLIEDSPSDAFLFKELLLQSHPGIKLLHAERLEDGLELLRDAAIEIVLLDLSLPDAHGIQTVSRTHAARPDAAIVVLTSLDDEATAVEAMQEGAQDYLVKDQTDRTLLARAIRYARERKRTEAAAHRFFLEQAARARAQEDERHARFLADASRALASSLDQDTTLAAVAKLAVPALADACLIDLVVEEGGARRVGAISLDGRAPETWQEDLARLPSEDAALRPEPGTGEVVVLLELQEPALRALALPERWAQPPPRAAAIFPLLAGGRQVGSMTFLAWYPERRQGYEALWALELAGQVSLALSVASSRPDAEVGRRLASTATPLRPVDESSLQETLLGAERLSGSLPLPAVGETMGGVDGSRFKIQAAIGAGSMGVVYQAKDRLLGRTVALKVMRLHPSGSPQRTVGLFLVEARAIARLNHQNIIRLFDAGAWRNLPYLVIEHLQGRPLYHFLSKGLFSPQRAVAVMVQVMDGLEHAHRHGIVHRDLKPSNVFLLADQSIKILDFGLAQMAAAMGNAMLPAAAGTPGYMAPEQWRGEPQDQRVDLWAAGVMLYEMLAGDRPFQAESTTELRDLVVSRAEPPPLQQLAPSLPPQAERLLRRALQKEPEQRFQSAAELRAALLELQPFLEVAG